MKNLALPYSLLLSGFAAYDCVELLERKGRQQAF
jgi:hypothetical protein